MMKATSRFKRYVLDTSALLSGKEFPNGELYIPPSVLEEMRPGGRMRRKVDFYLEAGMKVQEPVPESEAVVKRKAAETGDEARISETDLEVLALALDLGATILTDDYSIQNLARNLGIQYYPLQMRGIKEAWTWDYVCSGCGRRYEKPAGNCPECGSKIKTRRRLKRG